MRLSQASFLSVRSSLFLLFLLLAAGQVIFVMVMGLTGGAVSVALAVEMLTGAVWGQHGLDGSPKQRVL